MHSLDDRELLTAYATQGSEEAFAILVERHVSLVYSSVLRQVRDPHLAEEATQAVFALLAQKAGSLRREAVLAGWLCRAARLTARNWIRTERRRRQREQEAYMNAPADSEPDPWPEIMPLLDEAVADLRKADRDVLVLRFYQRKPFEEIGRALGLKVDAAEKRVTRALDKLRRFFAARGVVLTATAIATAISANAVQAAPAGLAVSVSSAAVKGTILAAGFGFGAKIVGALGKLATAAAAIPLLGSLLSMCVVSLIVRAERRNFRDQEGFRPKVYSGYVCSFYWGYPLLLLVMFGAFGWLAMCFGTQAQEDGLAVFCALLVLLSARSLRIARSPRHVAAFVYVVMLSVALWLRALGCIEQGVFWLLFYLAAVLQLWILKDRPIRMDFSLILRAAQGMLRHQESTGVSLPSFDRKSAMRFARFLGSRDLVANYAWTANGLLLRLAPVKARFLSNIVGCLVPTIHAGHSSVLLQTDGNVVAHCSQRDAADLAQFHRSVDVTELEARVASAVGNAWRSHQEGELGRAGTQIGELPESEVFVVSPKRSKSLRYYQAFLGVFIVIGLGLSILILFPPESWSRFVPCRATEAQIRAFLSQPRTRMKPSQSPPNSTVSALFMCLALPSTKLFTPEALLAVQNEVAGTGGFASMRGPSKAADWVFDTFWHGRAVNIG
jgi:RNA polymerase sigma factor (sigma-70 family)